MAQWPAPIWDSRVPRWSASDHVLDDTVHEDLVWCCPTPLLESIQVAGYVSFHDERVDVRVDGVLQDRPDSPCS